MSMCDTLCGSATARQRTGGWRRVIVSATQGKADVHMHTIHSDGTATVPELLEHVAANTDLKVIAVTDHDTIVGAREAHRIGPLFGIDVIIGQEVSTAEGHLLALFVDSFLPPGRPAVETIAAVHAQGGLCIAPHPFDTGVPSLGAHGLRDRCVGPRLGDWPLDGVESLNAAVAWPRRGCNQSARQLAEERHLAGLGGSDAHSLATVGQAYTAFPGKTANDLYHAIIRNQVSAGGHCWHLTHYMSIGMLYVRQRTLRGTLELLRSDGAMPLHH
jgi:predicted metal-dependent phosphoesterase TrpH